MLHSEQIERKRLVTTLLAFRQVRTVASRRVRVCQTVNAKFHDMVSANGTCVDNNICKTKSLESPSQSFLLLFLECYQGLLATPECNYVNY